MIIQFRCMDLSGSSGRVPPGDRLAPQSNLRATQTSVHAARTYNGRWLVVQFDKANAAILLGRSDLTRQLLKSYITPVFVTPKEVVAFRARDGQVPFEKWLNELNDKTAVARVLARLARLRQGNPGDCKSVGEGVSELRVDYGPGYRVYFGQKGRTLVVLLCGGDKRTQDRDIRSAKRHWREFNDSQS